MRLTIKYDWTEKNVVPPRCRKPRSVPRSGELEFTVPEVSSAEAPVAFRVTTFLDHLEEYRWHDESLYTPYLPWSGQREPSLPGSAHFPGERGHRCSYDVDSDAAARAEVLAEWSGKYLIVDGVVWARTGEPRYALTTQGLGNNHGGTSLSAYTYYNSNISHERYFRADDWETARARAVEVAERRGDTDSAAYLRKATPDIEVLIPEAVRCQPAMEHGDGDPFLNRLYAVTEAAPSQGAAAAAVLCIAASELASS